MSQSEIIVKVNSFKKTKDYEYSKILILKLKKKSRPEILKIYINNIIKRITSYKSQRLHN